MSAEPEVGFVEAAVRGRYLLRPAVDGGPAPLLVGFHGYGENAEASLAAVSGIPGTDGWHLAAVQALHPFYNTKTRAVVASWMTQLDRRRAIADNVRYVEASLEAIQARAPRRGPLALVGFSQGTAMAYRAAAAAGVDCDGVVALAGDVPPELAEKSWERPPRVLIGRGSDDTWYDEKKMTADLELLTRIGAEAEGLVFAGGHEWTAEFYQAAGRFLRALRPDSSGAGSSPDS